MAEKAVLLLYMGGPESFSQIRPFLYRMLSDPHVLPLPAPIQKPVAFLLAALRSPVVKKRYALIGGCSPLPRTTRAQAKALERRLGTGYRVFVGFRYVEPDIAAALRSAINAGARKLVALSLYPHYAGATSGTCFAELERALRMVDEELEVRRVERWGDFPPYLDALSEKVKQALEGFPPREEVEVLFSAHSLPLEMARRDGYEEQVRATCEGVAERAGIESYRLAYQSGFRLGRWLSPDVEQVLHTLAKRGRKSVLVVPVSFVSDHIETLYEIDFVYARLARKLGIEHFRRVEALGTSPDFIEALCRLVRDRS
ncbi:ferrochelatase [Candidatus Pyrohabitans sp.]